jgi:hypothetical protein
MLVPAIILGAVITGIFLVAKAAKNAPDGYEDSEGFHEGRPESKEREIEIEVHVHAS